MSSATNEIEEEIEEPEEECPKCPPAGLPAWMGTFADMAILLMCFFVLILSFAEFNVPNFKQITGSLNNALVSSAKFRSLSSPWAQPLFP